MKSAKLPRFCHSRCPKPKAFTLIELLVVIAIIALLVSILLPSLVKAKRLAHLVICSTNLSGFGRASQIYAGENDGWIPRDDWHGTKYRVFWATCYAPYLGEGEFSEDRITDSEWVTAWVQSHDFFTCPGIEYGGEESGLDYCINNFNWDLFHWNLKHGSPISERIYRKNDHDWPGEYDGAYRLDRIPVPTADLLYIAEGSRRFHIGFHDMHHSSHTTYNFEGKPKGGRMIKANDMRHDGYGAFVCFDGHVVNRALDNPDNFPMSLYIPNHPPRDGE